MKKSSYFLLLSIFILSFFSDVCAQAPVVVPAEHPGMVGLWTFDNQSSLMQATTGSDLETHGTVNAISGPVAGDNAINIGVGSYLTCYHNIAGNGGGSEVNEYTMVYDFKIPATGVWYCFYQANESNSNDGELFINPSGSIGRSTDGPGYSVYQVSPGEWYRMVVSVDLGNYYKVYLDGALILAGGSLGVDGSYSLYPADDENNVLFFADNDGEDNSFDIALTAIYNYSVNQAEVNTLGGYGHVIQPVLTGILPYLQTPTPNSMYISWHSDQTASTTVQYGISEALGLSQTGSYEDISGNTWHTVKLTGLIPETQYFYKCISGSEESELYTFKTPALGVPQNGHFRFIIVGDSRTDVAKTTEIAYAAKNKAIELFGDDIYNQINLVCHVGDIVSSGTEISQYKNEYFGPYACLSNVIPFMVSIGNHENEASNYYDYMKYEDFSDYTSFLLEEKFYSFYLSDIQFIMLNGNGLVVNSIQTGWLEDKLSQSDASPTTDMVFAFVHQPGHSELWPDGNTAYVQEDVLDALKQNKKVQLLSYGHSHCYERGVIESQALDAIGDFYIMLSGGAGSGLDRWGMYPNQQDYPEIQLALDHYCFSIVDVDLVNKSWDLYSYSLGNLDKPLDVVLVDQYHRKLLQDAPLAPIALSPQINSNLLPLLVASEMQGADSLMTSQFQLTSNPGNYGSPLLDVKRDWINVYWDSGAPDYLPIDLNQGIDLRRLQISAPLTAGNTYGWRVRYRDHNLRWSPWSAEKTFTAHSDLQAYTDFSADVTEGISPLTVHFSDLSLPVVSAWAWDFENDGTVDSNEQDPAHIYTQEGVYTVSLTTANGTETKDYYINAETNSLEEIINKGSDNVQVRPNPFYISTAIDFTLKTAGKVVISVLDAKGNTIRVLENTVFNAGKHTVMWNAGDGSANRLSPGKYFVKVTGAGIDAVKSVILIDK
ncbi:MAG: metallophosphoesterase [Bacteroidales bacterium]|nr:metallophosphoesterase [Bacteroidales bacterium]HOY37692.1 metallophosphoesterase [Bacteroidales bacterium]HQP04540.1 metallophosphoesterase [Bacteroidales bacterium]